MIVADVTFYPIGKGISVSDAIKGVISKLRESGLKVYPNSMATVIESPDMENLLEAVRNGEKYLTDLGYTRVETILRIDHRLDLDNSVERKLRAIGEL
jgi:uncharacterized protein (TIGR00106 family)